MSSSRWAPFSASRWSPFHSQLHAVELIRSILLCWVALGLSVPPPAQAAQRLRPQGLVNDFAGVVNPQAAQQLESALLDLERQTGVEVALVTVPTVPEGDIEKAAADLVRDWGIGKRGKDNGVLILCAVQDRRVRIEVGYGLEAILPDAKTGRIIDERMLPHFRADDLSTGLVNGALAVADVIARDAGVTLSGGSLAVPERTAPPSVPWNSVLSLVFFGCLVVLACLNPRSFFWLLLGMMGSGSRSGWEGGGGFSGGFGGFGGGMSGGGGASRSW